MTLYALENLDDALDVTREFLTPFDRTKWIKLAFVVFFIGLPGLNLNVPQASVPSDGEPAGPGAPPGDFVLPELGAGDWALIAAIVGGAFVLWLAFALVSAIMEFVFVESLRSETVAVRRYWSRRWRQGVRLFAFRIAIGLVAVGAFVLAGIFVFLPMVFDPTGGGISVAILVVLVPALVVLAILVGLIDGFTTVFVVPIMILEECGVVAGWRRLWPTIAAQWKQYLAYAVAGFVLSIAAGLLVGIVVGILAVVLLVPFGILFALGFGVLSVAGPVGIALLVVVGLLYALSVGAVAALVQVPVQAYLRYYALLVLGAVDAELDLVPTQRAAVREPDAA